MAHDGHMKPEHRAARQLREGGYSRRKDGDIHQDAAADAKMVSAGVHQHEAALHKGSPKTKLKFRSGGKVPGHEPKGRPDRRARGGGMEVNEMMGRDLPNDAQGNVHERSARAKGGGVEGKKHGRVVINIKAGGDDQQKMLAAHQAGMQQGAALGARAAAAKMAGGAGGPPPGAGMPPPGAGGPPGGMPPRPMMPPPGAAPGGPPGAMPPRPMPPGAGPMRSGGTLRPRGSDGRFSGGAL